MNCEEALKKQCSCNNEKLSSIVWRHYFASYTSFAGIKGIERGLQLLLLLLVTKHAFIQLCMIMKKHKCWFIEKVLLLLVCSSYIVLLLASLIMHGKVGGNGDVVGFD